MAARSVAVCKAHVVAHIVVAVLSATAVGVAGLLLVRLRSTERAPPAPTAAASARQRLGEAVRATAAAVAGGILAGLLVAGFGGRLLMRVIGATSDDAAQGRLTEAGEVVGRVTGGGTAFFVFFGAGIGLLGGLGYFLLRRWLPRRSLPAGLVAAGIGAAALARPTDLLNPESIDFEILGPRWLAVVLALVLIAGLGSLGAVLIDSFTRQWPSPALTVKGVAGLAPLVVLAGLGPAALILLPVIAVRTMVRPGPQVADATDIARAIPALLLVAGSLGWLWTLATAAQIAF